MTGRDLMNYILDNRLEDAEVDFIDDITFEVPVTNVFVFKEDVVGTLRYHAHNDNVCYLYNDEQTAEFISYETANEIRNKVKEKNK